MTRRTTEEYRPEEHSRGISERIHVAVLAGSGPVAENELLRLLRRRLLVLSSILACIAFIGICISLLAPRDEFLEMPSESRAGEVIKYWPGLLLLSVTGISTYILWRRPPRTITGIRTIEILVVGALTLPLMVISVLPVPYDPLIEAGNESLRVRSALVGRYSNASSLLWFFVISAYGMLIPNTWRRCAIVSMILAVGPLGLFAVCGFWLRPLDPEIASRVVIDVGFTNAVAVALALFASSRIEYMRKQVTEARKLGQYMLKEPLGAGGMGEVYRAEHLLLRRPCAIKLIRPERAGDSKNLRRFEREVQMTATLTHPNTIQIYDYGRSEDGTFYYVMEYLHGHNLEQMVKQVGPLPPERAVHLLRQLCGALREAHAAGLIHRDIKPSNVIVCERGGLHDVAKLLDFGIVETLIPDQGTEITAHGQLLGTPAYMSPEQATGDSNLDARSDLSSLGATAYFMLTGKPPFDYPTINLIITAQIRDTVTPPHRVRESVPVDLSAVIVRCLEKDPALRFQNAADLEKALAECACAGGWTEECAARAGKQSVNGDESRRVSTLELERRWGI